MRACESKKNALPPAKEIYKWNRVKKCDVCVYVLSRLFWRQSHGARRDVSFTLQCIQGTTLCSVLFCPSDPTGATQDGGLLGLSSSLYDSLMPRPSCGACLHFHFSREKGSAVPVPRRQRSRILFTHEAFRRLTLSTTRYESEKK